MTAEVLDVNEPLITIRNGYRHMTANNPTKIDISMFPNVILCLDLLITAPRCYLP